MLLGLRKCWSLLYRQKLPRPETYAFLKRSDFTSEQVGSLLMAAEMKHAALVALRGAEQVQLRLAILKRERAISDKQRKIVSLQKRQSKLRQQLQNVVLEPGMARSMKRPSMLAQLRAVSAELAFCRNWVQQKTRVLVAKRGQLTRLQSDMAIGRYRLCFGRKKLLAQRPAAHNADSTAFASIADWKRTWDLARNGQWWSVGRADKPQGNAEVQWLPETKQIRLRLTDYLAHQRMDERGIPRSGTKQSDMPQRMQCRFIVIDDVDFTSHKGAAATALQDAFGKRPVTMRVLARLQANCTLVWYIQASVDVPTGDGNGTPVRSRKLGLLDWI